VFSHEGPSRSPRKNAVLAGYLACTAGFVNSGGYVLIGSFTSHVTGSVGRLANDLATGDFASALSALFLVATFFAGAFVASLIVEASDSSHRQTAYGQALLLEGGLLATFIFVAGLSQATHPRIRDAEAAFLCAAMGAQNSLVTSLSGSVIRTTHLTGVMTDFGIEVARWYRWHRAKLHQLPRLLPSRRPPERPRLSKIVIPLIIIGAFIAGAALGAILTLRASRWSMVLPAAAVLLASAYAFLQQDALEKKDESVPESSNGEA
jgi:uncharacterized membrane protein YoaK (UPF0700 family)